MSDRDKITEAYNAVSDTLWVINASALCQKLNIKEPQFGLIKQNDADLWCDMYIRIADYVAGIAAWDPPNTNSLSKKIISLIEKVFSGNRYLGLFRVAFFVVDNKYFNVKISRVAINKATHQAARRSHKKAQSLRGLSRKIQFKRE
ncbi:hypothetical protein ACLRDC_16925 [Gluconacetobacter sacchari]|uniref:hypothetical protein n=1 Tax=Gluconacetobacter sacchari TaxID=92759 RepID=UPI0039B5C898